ncbi:MAG: GIY-YIG nuclease family protein, partial [bacterium]
MTGTYLLDIFLQGSRTIRIGQLGRFSFRKGHYVYVGSAKKNFYQRIDRHLREKKKMYWHVDYLLQHARVTNVWSCDLAEERVADILSALMRTPVLHFGASDKRSTSHLFYGALNEYTPG